MFSVELYGRVRHACHVEGLSQREAARRFGVHRNTVRKMLAFSVPPGYRRGKPPSRPRVHALEIKGWALCKVQQLQGFIGTEESGRLSAAMVLLSRSRDIDRGFLPGRKRPLAYLSEITFDPTCGFAVPRRCALPGAVALDRSAGETVQRWPSSVTTVTDLRL